MPTVSDLDNTLLSNLNHIDALLDEGPDWNFTTGGNTISYTFSVSSGNESGNTSIQGNSLSAFSASQQASARTAMAYVSALTGIVFTETGNGAAAQVHLANVNILSQNTSGLCSWSASYSITGGNNVSNYTAKAYVYLDNAEFAFANGNLFPGGQGYETLLHELGHMLGLKHPFADDIHLPFNQDTTAFTLMSYTASGGSHAEYSPYDVAALNWIYGGDGLAGPLGMNSTSGARYLTGTSAADSLVGTQSDDTLRGNGGNDMINGGAGNDTAVFSGNRSGTDFSDAGGTITATGTDGVDTLTSIEVFRFIDGSYTRAQVLGDVTPPGAPTQNVAKNAAGYVGSNTPSLYGIGEAGATIKIFSGTTLLGSTVVAANGFFNVTLAPLANGSYLVYSTATDAAGNVSGASANLSFSVDATPPSVPTAAVAPVVANMAAFSGTGEAGTTISLVNTGNVVLGQTTVSAGGTWSIAPPALSNGIYQVRVQSADVADNITEAVAPLVFSVNTSLNRLGGAAWDNLATGAGNNAVDGGAGIDTALYSGARANYDIAKFSRGMTVTAKTGDDGADALYNVERVQFADAAVALDISGNGGEIYRLYRAALDRAPDMRGLGFWIAGRDQGVTLESIAAQFLTSPEYESVYGANLTSAQFLFQLYANVLHRAPDQSGYDFWLHAMDVEHETRAHLLAQFSESPENQAQVIGSIQNGFEYALWTGS